MENNRFYLNGVLVRKFSFGKVARGTISVYSDGRMEYIPFIAFRDVARTVSSFIDGSEVSAECRLHSSSYEKDGKRVYSTDVVVDVISCVDSDD